MKPFPLSLPVFLFVLLTFGSLAAQDLNHLYEIGHYRLIHSSQDLNGNLDSMQLDNAPYDGTNGVYSNGIYPGDDPENASYIRTPHLTSLYDEEFAITLIFRLGNLDGKTRPVVVLGESYRYLGFEVTSENKFTMLFNNNQHIEIADLTASPDSWYELTILHNESTNITEFYLDMDLVGTIDGALVRAEGDGRISNVNPSNGQAYLGHWQNLFIYGSEDITAVKEALSSRQSMAVFPNPTTGHLQIKYLNISAARWSVTDLNGSRLMGGEISDPEQEFNISFLPDGVFMLSLYDPHGTLLVTRKFVKSNP